MQYDTIEELTLELALYPNKKLDILEDCARKCKHGWFTVAKDGNCALFDENGELDDINKVKSINEGMIPKDIEKIIIPDSAMNIWDDAFYGCHRLMNVIIPDTVTSIGVWTFAWCSRLTSIMIPDSVTSIGNEVFFGCSNLKELVFKGKTIEEVQSMENYPFGIRNLSIIRCEG